MRRSVFDPRRRELPLLVECARLFPQPRPFVVARHVGRRLGRLEEFLQRAVRLRNRVDVACAPVGSMARRRGLDARSPPGRQRRRQHPHDKQPQSGVAICVPPPSGQQAGCPGAEFARSRLISASLQQYIRCSARGECYLGYTPAAGQAAVRSLIKGLCKGRLAAADAIVNDDLNMAAAALLYDMAALQSTERSQFGYKRAAKAIVGLPVVGRRSRRGRNAARRRVRRARQRAGRHRARRAGTLSDGRSGAGEITEGAAGPLAPSIPRVIPQPRGPAAGAGRAARRPHRQPRRDIAAIFRCTRRGAMGENRSRRWRRRAGVWATAAWASPTTRTACRSRAGSPWRTSRGSIARSTS